MSLLSAAAFVGNVTLVERLLETATDPTQSDGIFPSAIEAAALAGNFEISQMIQENLPDTVEAAGDEANRPQPFLYNYSLSEIHNQGKSDIQGIVGACHEWRYGALGDGAIPSLSRRFQ